MNPLGQVGPFRVDGYVTQDEDDDTWHVRLRPESADILGLSELACEVASWQELPGRDRPLALDDQVDHRQQGQVLLGQIGQVRLRVDVLLPYVAQAKAERLSAPWVRSGPTFAHYVGVELFLTKFVQATERQQHRWVRLAYDDTRDPFELLDEARATS